MSAEGAKPEQTRSQSGALGARAPLAIPVHTLPVLTTKGTEDLEVKDTEKF